MRAARLNSAVYIGHVRHRRFAERERSFSHRIALAYVDLEESQARVRRDRHLRPDDVRARVAAESGSSPGGPIRLLTHPRGFNPVSFYYCFDANERLEALLAEVTNTPWGERQTYVLTRAGRTGPILVGESEKLMHVSPFFGMDQRYEWRVSEPGKTLSVHIENHERGERVFDATLSLKRHELTRGTLAATRASALRVLPLIYGHAAALRLSGIRTRPHPEAGTKSPTRQRTGTVPHA